MNGTYQNGVFGADEASSELNPLDGQMDYWAVYADLPGSVEATWLIAVPDRRKATALVDALSSLDSGAQRRLQDIEGGAEPADTLVRPRHFDFPFGQSASTWQLTWRLVILGIGPEKSLRAIAAVLPLLPTAARDSLLAAYLI